MGLGFWLRDKFDGNQECLKWKVGGFQWCSLGLFIVCLCLEVLWLVQSIIGKKSIVGLGSSRLILRPVDAAGYLAV